MLKPLSITFKTGRFFLPLVFSLLFFAACHPKTAPAGRYLLPMVASTDDTIHNYAIALFSHHRFAYTITYENQ